MISSVPLRYSLKARVTVSSLVIFVISIWSLAFYASHLLREEMTRRLGEQELSTAKIIAAEIDDQLKLRFQALDKAAKEVAPFMLDRTALQKEFNQQTILSLMFNGGVILLGADGIAIADQPLPSARTGLSYMADEWNSTALKEGKSVLGRPIVGKVLGMPVFAMTTPIRDPHGKVIGALAAVVNLGNQNFLDIIAHNAYGVTGHILLVSPKDRLIVTASDKHRIMEQYAARGINPPLDRALESRGGTYVINNPRGVEVLNSSAIIPISGWHVVVSLPTVEAFAPIHDMQLRIIFAALLLSMLAGVLSCGRQRDATGLSFSAVAVLFAPERRSRY